MAARRKRPTWVKSQASARAKTTRAATLRANFSRAATKIALDRKPAFRLNDYAQV